MRTRWHIAASLVAGIFLGAVPMDLWHEHRFKSIPDPWLFTYYTYHTIQDVDTLIALRRGETNDVINEIEEDLSEQIYSIVRDYPKQGLSNKDSVRILSAAARYRSDYPFKTGNEDKDRMVTQLLAKVRKE